MLNQDNNKALPKGDFLTAEEALLDNDWEIRSRCESVNEVVSNNIIPFAEALNAYEVSPEQFFKYVVKKDLNIEFDSQLIKIFLHTFLTSASILNSSLDEKAKKIVDDMRQLSIAE